MEPTNNLVTTPPPENTVLPFTVTFHVQTPEQAHRLAEFFYHHGISQYQQLAPPIEKPDGQHYLADFTYDDEGPAFFGIPRDPLPEWKRKVYEQGNEPF